MTAAERGHMDALRTPVGLDDIGMWSRRDPENKRHMVVREVASRLRGLSCLMYGQAVGRRQMGDPNTDQTSFLAAAVADLALALERATASYVEQREEEEDAQEAAERKVLRGKKKRDGS